MQSTVRKLRREHKMSQKQLADVLGTSQQTISRMEKDILNAQLDLLISMADLFEVSLDYLLERNEYGGKT